MSNIEEFKNKVVNELEFLVDFYKTSKDADEFADQIVGIQEAIGVVEEKYLQLGGK